MSEAYLVPHDPYREVSFARKAMRFALRGALLIFVLFVISAAVWKVWWDSHFFDGYDPKLPLNAEVVEKQEVNGHIREKVRFQGLSGEMVPALFHYPMSATGASPCLLLVYGIGQNMKFLDEIAEQYIQNGIAVFCFEHLGRGERKAPGEGGLDALFAFSDRLSRMVNEARRSVDYLVTRKEIDSANISYFGISLGAIMGSTTLAVEPRFKAGILMWGGGDLPNIIALNRFSQEKIGSIQRTMLAKAVKLLFSPAEPLKRIHLVSPRPILFQNALKDEIIPKACTEAYFNKALEPKKILWYECGHEKGLNVDLIHQIIDAQIAWMKTLAAGASAGS